MNNQQPLFQLTSKILNTIETRELGLRAGTDTEGAAYGLKEFGFDRMSMQGVKEQIKWISNPDSNSRKTQDWLNHLYNSILFTDILTQRDNKGNYTLLIVDWAQSLGKRPSDTYRATGGKGDGTTFVKCVHLPSESQILAQQTFDVNHVDDAVQWVLDQIAQL